MSPRSERDSLVATHLRDNTYAVRPAGALGTCGWVNGRAWTVRYVHAWSENDAVRAINDGRRPHVWEDMVE